MPTGKHLSVFGMTEKGSKRWELYKGSATGYEWRNAVGMARERPPKQHFRRLYVRDMEIDDFEGEWIDEPEIKS